MKHSFNEKTKIIFISSTGGHFAELMQLKPIMDKCNYHIVTEKTATNKNLKEKYKNKLDFLVYGTRKTKLLYPFILLINCFISLFIFLKIRPQVIITTGTHTAGPMCCIAKIFGCKIIYIETFANRTSKTATGKLLYHIADTFVVQWEEMLELYPKAKYWGVDFLMIFVTLGTQDKPFERLIKAVENQVELGNITEEVIVQSGCTKYISDKLKIIPYMTIDELNKYLIDARLIITHAGVGTIIQALEIGKTVIAAARKKEFGEHVSDHQQQFLENFSSKGYIIPLLDFDKLDEVIKQAEDFKPNKFESNNSNFITSTIQEINNLLS